MLKFLYTETFKNLLDAGKVVLPTTNENISCGYDIHLPIEEAVTIEPKEFKAFNLECKIKNDSEDTIYQAELYMPETLNKKGLIFATPYFRFNEDAIQSVKVYNFSDSPVVINPNDIIATLVVTEAIVNEPLSSKGIKVEYKGAELSDPARATFDIVSTEDIVVDAYSTKDFPTGLYVSSLEENKFTLVQLNDAVYTTYGAVFADGFNLTALEDDIVLHFLNLNYAPVVIPKGMIVGTLIVRNFKILDSFECEVE